MLFLFTLLGGHTGVASNDLNNLGLILGIVIVEVVREMRAWQRGRRLRDVERDIAECLARHHKISRRNSASGKPKHPSGSAESHGPN